MPLHQLVEPPLKQAFIVFCFAGVAALVGVAARDPKPVICFLGAAGLGVMAAARLGALHYFAPAYVLSVPAAIWLFRRRQVAGVVAAVLLVVVLGVAFVAPPAQAKNEADRFAAQVAPGEAWVCTPACTA